MITEMWNEIIGVSSSELIKASNGLNYKEALLFFVLMFASSLKIQTIKPLAIGVNVKLYDACGAEQNHSGLSWTKYIFGLYVR